MPPVNIYLLGREDIKFGLAVDVAKHWKLKGKNTAWLSGLN